MSYLAPIKISFTAHFQKENAIRLAFWFAEYFKFI